MIKIIDEKSFTVEEMKNGRLSAGLISDVGWEGFPGYVLGFLELFSGAILMKNDSADTRVWRVIISGEEYDMVYEDFPVLISIESKSEKGDFFLLNLKNVLSTIV